MSRAEAKAVGVASFVAVLRQMVQQSEFDKFVATLPRDTAEIVARPPLPVTWIPVETTFPLYEGAFERLFGGDVERMFEAGRIQLKNDFRGIYRMFIRIATPAYVAARTSQIWETYTRNGGVMQVVVEQPTLIEIQVTGHARPSRAIWHLIRGSIHGVIELTGVKSPRVTIVTGGGLGPDTRFRITWE